MRLRSLMIIVFCIAAIAPMAIFWLWPHSRALESEIENVRERHLVIAKNLVGAMDRYYVDLVNTFSFVVKEVSSHDNIGHMTAILDNLHIRHICVANYQSGLVLKSLQTSDPKCPATISTERLTWIKQQIGSNEEEVIITGVRPLKNYGNVIYMLRKQKDTLFMGIVSTKYLIDLGNVVSFGKNGHAAIIDQTGRVISHPVKDWQDTRKDISELSVVQRMRDVKNGTTTFYSPAFKEDVIAGFASGEISNWGVMIPQPLSELHNKATEIKNTALTIMAIGFIIALILAYFASRILTHPIEQIVQSMRSIGNGELLAHEKIIKSRFQPKEFEDAREGIKVMANKLQENMDTISRHAYLDGITGLPNRECFKVLAQEEIEKLSLTGNTGAILFLDLDGFKQVNDVYGHRAGDDLLLAFSQKLHTYCGIFMKRHARGVKNVLSVLPARLGGDEFVVLLGNIAGSETTTEFADGLFARVFGKYKLHNGVELNVSGSVGGAIFPDQAADFDELLRLADIAMYEAKNSGKGRYCLHSEVNEYFDEHSHA